MNPPTVNAYQAPWWLPDGHSQTIYPAICVARPKVAYRRERWATPDGDFIDVDWTDAPHTHPNSPLVVLFHGLEGSSDSHYARALMAAVQQRGWQGVVPHFRGCSGELNHAPRFYHSGDSGEIGWVLARLHQAYCVNPSRPLFVAGVSLGGNALLRFLGEQGHAAEFVQAAAAISAPLNLSAGGAALGKGFNRVYTQMFLNTLKVKCVQKLAQHPRLFDRDAMQRSRNLYEFDNIVTAPLHGYRNTEDYWLRASSLPILPEVRVPTLVLNAQNDPFLPAEHLPQPHQVSTAVTLEQPQHGGHVGFLSAGALPMKAAHLNWLPERILAHFAAHLSPTHTEANRHG